MPKMDVVTGHRAYLARIRDIPTHAGSHADAIGSGGLSVVFGTTDPLIAVLIVLLIETAPENTRCASELPA
jgi:ABC-type Co2+ transport system permease subunit